MHFFEIGAVFVIPVESGSKLDAESDPRKWISAHRWPFHDNLTFHRHHRHHPHHHHHHHHHHLTEFVRTHVILPPGTCAREVPNPVQTARFRFEIYRSDEEFRESSGRPDLSDPSRTLGSSEGKLAGFPKLPKLSRWCTIARR